jgi:muconolactone delta-isomerase
MKFLVMTTRRQNVPIPPEAIARLLRAQQEWFEEHLADGTIDCAYGYPQGGGGVGIANADTTEELNELISEWPLFPIADVEVRPLTDVAVTLKNGAEAAERIAHAIA